MKFIFLSVVSIMLLFACRDIGQNKEMKNRTDTTVKQLPLDSSLLSYQGYWHCIKYSSFPKGIERSATSIEYNNNVIENYTFRIYNDTLELKSGCKTIVGYWKGRSNKHIYDKKDRQEIYNEFYYKMTDTIHFLYDATPVAMFISQREKECRDFSFDDIIVINKSRLLLYKGGDYYLFEKFIPANIGELVNSTTPWPVLKKNIILQDDGCFRKSAIVLPYNKRMPYDSAKAEVLVKYEELKCAIGNSEQSGCNFKDMRYIPFPNKGNIRVILIPQDLGDFSYNFYLLLIVNNAYSDQLYVEGIHYEPEDYESTKTRSYFEIDKDYNITVTTEHHSKIIAKEKYRITDEGKFEKY